MKFTIGLIFALINVSISRYPLREVQFIRNLFPEGSLWSIPKPIFLALVNRRIAQVNSLYSNPMANHTTTLLPEKTFYMFTNHSLLLIPDLLGSDDEKYADTIVFYEEAVKLLNDFKDYLEDVKLSGRNRKEKTGNIDYYDPDSKSYYPRDKLQELVDSYIDDIKLVNDYEESLGNPTRVDKKIVNHLKSLSKDLKTYIIPVDDPNLESTESYQIMHRKLLDQCMRRLNFLLEKFKVDFTNK